MKLSILGHLDYFITLCTENNTVITHGNMPISLRSNFDWFGYVLTGTSTLFLSFEKLLCCSDSGKTLFSFCRM